MAWSTSHVWTRCNEPFGHLVHVMMVRKKLCLVRGSCCCWWLCFGQTFQKFQFNVFCLPGDHVSTGVRKISECWNHFQCPLSRVSLHPPKQITGINPNDISLPQQSSSHMWTRCNEPFGHLVHVMMTRKKLCLVRGSCCCWWLCFGQTFQKNRNHHKIEWFQNWLPSISLISFFKEQSPLFKRNLDLLWSSHHLTFGFNVFCLPGDHVSLGAKPSSVFGFNFHVMKAWTITMTWTDTVENHWFIPANIEIICSAHSVGFHCILPLTGVKWSTSWMENHSSSILGVTLDWWVAVPTDERKKMWIAVSKCKKPLDKELCA